MPELATTDYTKVICTYESVCLIEFVKSFCLNVENYYSQGRKGKRKRKS